MSAARDGLRPGGRVHGAPRVPGSKSIAQRALVCAALARGRTRLAALPDAEDVRHLARALAATGSRVAFPAPRAASVEGRPPGPGGGWATDEAEPPRLAVGESGTAARLVSAAAALCGRAGGRVRVEGSGSLERRRSPALFAALSAAGVECVHAAGAEGGWPVTLRPLGPPSELVLERPGSSQEVSALLIALAAWPGEFVVRVVGPIPSRPYVALTRSVLASFGVRVGEAGERGGEAHFTLRGPLAAPETPLIVEPDASAAAVALAAGCLSGGEARIEGLAESAQGDVRVIEHLAAFGCRASRTADGALVAAGAPTRGARLDLGAEPDLAPVLAAVAAAAALGGGGTSRLEGLGTLPGKESSRIEVLAAGLRAIGLEARAGGDWLAVGPGTGGGAADRGGPGTDSTRSPGPLALDPAGDHRMAFAFALLGLVKDGVDVLDPGCVAKSWPSFWDDLERAGARRRT